MMMGPPPLIYHRADFNGADSATLGSDWDTLSGTASAKIATNAAQQRTMSSGNGNNGCWHRYKGGLNNGALLGDNWQIRAEYQPPVGAAAANMLTMLLGAINDAMASGTCVSGGTVAATSANGAGILTQVGQVASPYNPSGQSGQTSQSVVNGMGTGTYEVILERKKNIFRLLKNGALVAGWTDASNIVGSGAANRRWGFNTQGNFPVFQQNFYSPALDWIEAYDIPA